MCVGSSSTWRSALSRGARDTVEAGNPFFNRVVEEGRAATRSLVGVAQIRRWPRRSHRRCRRRPRDHPQHLCPGHRDCSIGVAVKMMAAE